MTTLKGSRQEHIIDIIFTLALFCVLAASLLTVVILGANVYTTNAGEIQHNYEVRTSLGYVSGKIRQNDASGSVSVGELGGVPALILHQTVADSGFVTYIYYYDGALREIFAGEGTAVSPESGQKIVEIGDFTFEEPEKGVFRLECTDSNGAHDQMIVSLRCD